MSVLRASGTVASIGYASGRLYNLDSRRADYQPSGDATTEAARLRQALSAALESLDGLIAAAEEDGGEILEFQTAMIEDDTLSEPAFGAIASGIDAASAWTAAIGAQIADYEAAGDEYFRARSADLRDIADRVSRALAGVREETAPPGAVLHARDLTPTDFLSMDWRQGGAILLREGSSASHVAMLARTRGVPMLVGVHGLEAANDDLVLVDAEKGLVTVQPDTAAQHEFLKASAAHRQLLKRVRERINEPAVTADGARVDVLVNIADPDETAHIDIASCDGVGLMRTEFLFGHGLPDEEVQLAAYRKVLTWAGGKPVTIRTVDAGGDKPVPGFTVAETNPFLGLRGIRLCLQRPDVFRVQVRALLRAAAAGNLKVMFPMVSIVAEYAAARSIVEEEASALRLAVPPLGIMVEVPAVAIDPGPFHDVAFLSIGSNDLTQYVLAAARDNGMVAGLNNTAHPAVLKLIGNVVQFAESKGVSVSLCGDAGGDPAVIPALLAKGLRSLSVAPSQLALAKAAIGVATTMGRDGQG
jgi:phosphoenolpyruvate-protein phosphotransferase (PTS system enzyme I)